jgi:hypothetical protein
MTPFWTPPRAVGACLQATLRYGYLEYRLQAGSYSSNQTVSAAKSEIAIRLNESG